MKLKRPASLEALLEALQKLPSIGRRSAERLASHLLTAPQAEVEGLAAAMLKVRATLLPCGTCGHLTENQPCEICSDSQRDDSLLCVIAGEKELYALAEAGVFNGRFHVLGGLISPLKGIGPKRLRLEALHARLQDGAVTELVLALPPTTEGETTAHYLKETVPAGIKLTRLGIGIPLGADLDYLDAGTLDRALQGRQEF
jgi:recombination protein RecR